MGVLLSFHLNINFAWLFSPVSLGPPLDSWRKKGMTESAKAQLVVVENRSWWQKKLSTFLGKVGNIAGDICKKKIYQPRVRWALFTIFRGMKISCWLRPLLIFTATKMATFAKFATFLGRKKRCFWLAANSSVDPCTFLEKRIFPPEGGAGESRCSAGVGVRVVTVKVTVLQYVVRCKKKILYGREEGNHLEEDEVVGVHDLLTEHHRQELVEGDVLDQGRVDVASLLERSTFMALTRI